MESDQKATKRKADELEKPDKPSKVANKSDKPLLGSKPKLISPIKLNIQSQEKPVEVKKEANEKLREIFNSDDESEEEEIPVEARIRMRNLGRYTPTSCGPNSFGKGRFGFIDRRALLDRQTEALNAAVSEDNVS